MHLNLTKIIKPQKILKGLFAFMFAVNSMLPQAIAKTEFKNISAKSDPSINVIHKRPVVNKTRPVLKFSQNPSDDEIKCSHVFIEPIIPLSNVKTNLTENKILAFDLMYFQNKQEEKGLNSLDSFIKKYPDSKWTPSLEVQLASIYFIQGYFTKAMAYWLDAFNKAHNDKSIDMKHLANEAISKLLIMNCRIGRIDEIKKLLALCNGRRFSGSSAARLKTAKASLWAMTHSPSTSFECGPLAVNLILGLKNKQIPCGQLCNLLPSTAKGTNMYDVALLANKLNLPLMPVKIAANTPIPIPAVVHWKLGHYSAITGYYNGKYHVQDATFGLHNNYWMDRRVFDKEASGEYLVLADNSAYGDLNLDKVKAKIKASTSKASKSINGKNNIANNASINSTTKNKLIASNFKKIPKITNPVYFNTVQVKINDKASLPDYTKIKLPAGITPLTKEQALAIWGKGVSQGRDPAKTPSNPNQCPLNQSCNKGKGKPPRAGNPGSPNKPPNSPNQCPPGDINCNGPCGGMARVNMFTMQSSASVNDTPLSYKPPLGPDIDFSLNYNIDEEETPDIPFFTNFGPNWSFKYVAYLTVDASQNVTVHPPGGGVEIYNFNPTAPTLSNPYAPNLTSQAVLTQISAGIFTRTLPDGTIEQYDYPVTVDTSNQANLMTIIKDPQNNQVAITYNGFGAYFLITFITDAIGQSSSIAYGSGTAPYPYPPASITDPFGRQAFFTYDPTNEFLQAIQDTIGIISRFTYSQTGSTTDMTSITTPYGVTSFYQFTPLPTNNSQYPPTGYKFFFPDGTSSIIENYIDETKTTYFWDRQAMADYPNDYLSNNFFHCKTYKWLFDGNMTEEPVLHYEQGPNTGATYYTYDGQGSNTDVIGTSNNPQTSTQLNNTPTTSLTITGITPTPQPPLTGLTVGDVYTLSLASAAISQSSNNLAQVSYTVVNGDTIASVMSHLATNINNNKALNVNAVAIGTNLILNSTLTANNSYIPMTYMGITNLTYNEPAYMTFSNPPTSGLNIQAAQVTGAVSTNDVINFTVTNSSLPGGKVTVSHTVTASDTLASIATALVGLINANSNLASAGISAQTGNNAIISLFANNGNSTTYSYSVTGSGTEKITIGQTPGQNQQVSLTGSYALNDTLTLTVNNANLTSPITATYTVNSGDTSSQLIMQHFAQAINSLPSFSSAGIVADYNYASPSNSFNIVSNSGYVANFAFTASGAETFGLAPYYHAAQVYQYAYNAAGKVIQSIDPIGRTFSYYYAANNIDLLEARETQGSDNNLMAKWIYEDNTHPVTTQHTPYIYIDANCNQSTFTYNAYGQLLTATDPNNDTITYNYNVNGYLMSIDGPMPGSGDVTQLNYDRFGRLSSTTNSQGYVIQYSYDNANRLTQITYPDGTSNTAIYNNLDIVQTNDRLNRSTTRVYDSMDQLVSETDALGHKTTYTWCNCGSLSSMTDANGNTTHWHHDLNGRLITKTMADNTEYNYSYDPLSRLSTILDPKGQEVFINYNVDDTLASKCFLPQTISAAPTGESTKVFGYDPTFNRQIIAFNSFGPITYTYNPYNTDPYGTPTLGAGQLASVSNPVYSGTTLEAAITSYTYDKLGRVTNRSINGSANSNTYTYDQMSRLTSMANSSSNSSGGLGTFNFNYENNITNNSLGDRRLASINYPNGQVASFNYLPNFNDERLSNINNQASSSSSTPNQVLSNYSYAYNSGSEIVNSQEQNYNNKINSYKYDNDGELIEALSNYGNNPPPIMNQNYNTYDKVYNRTSDQNSAVEVLNIGGTPLTNDVITVTMTGYGLSPNPITASYTVAASDTLTTIAQNLSAAITNAPATSTNAWGYGIAAYPVLNKPVIHIRSAANYHVNYTVSVTNSGGTPTTTATLGNDANVNTLAAVNGTITAGDVLNIIINDANLTGGSATVSYTVLSSDTKTSIASNLTNAINSNTSLKTLGVTATSYNNVIVIASASPNTTTYNASSSNSGGNGYATESVNFNLNQNTAWQIVITGSITTGDVLNAYVYDASLPNNVVSVSHTVASSDSTTSIATALVSGINSAVNSYGINANNIDSSTKLATNIITLTSNSLNQTSYVANGTPVSPNKATTESLLVTQNTNATQCLVVNGTVNPNSNTIYVLVNNSALTSGNYNPGQELVTYTTVSNESFNSVAANLTAAINSDANLQNIGVTAIQNGNIVYVTSQSGFSTTYTSYTSAGAEIGAVIPQNINANSFAHNSVNEITNIGGNVANGNNVTLQSNANTVIPSSGISTVANSINIYAPLINDTETLYSTSTSTNATEILTLGTNNAGNVNLAITGYPTNGDTVTLNIITPTQGTIPITTTITSNTQPLAQIAANIVNSINSNSTLQSLNITASNTGTSSLPTSNIKYNTNILLTGNNGSGSDDNRTYTNVPNPLTSSSTSNNYYNAYKIKSPGPFSPSYDNNGNMLADSINTYAYNAENQLSQITNANNAITSVFIYDALGRLVEITDTNNSTGATSTRQFIWCGNSMCEARDENNALVTQYFNYGQISYSGSTGTNYYITRDELNSVREVTDAKGNLITQYNYTPYGNVTVNSGTSGQAPSVTSDFQYAGYYYHAASGLNITLNRAYSAFLGRWLTRDPIGEAGGINLYGYVGGDPVGGMDPSGLWKYYENWGGPGWTNKSGKWSELQNFPHLPWDPDFYPPTNKRDQCYYQHDTCLHNQTNIKDSAIRRSCRRGCDRKLASCLSQLSNSFWGGNGILQGFEIDLFNGKFGLSPNDNSKGELPQGQKFEFYKSYTYFK